MYIFVIPHKYLSAHHYLWIEIDSWWYNCLNVCNWLIVLGQVTLQDKVSRDSKPANERYDTIKISKPIDHKRTVNDNQQLFDPLNGPLVW